MMRNTQYNINLGKGCGLIEETLTLLSVCDETTTKDSLAAMVHENNLLSKSTDKRSMDIVKVVFFPRFMKNNPKVVLWLKAIRAKGLLLSQFKQLLMIYCARENAVMYDYITHCLNNYRLDNLSQIPVDSIKNFVENIVANNEAKWGESIRKRSASYIKSVLVDFDMLNRRGDILPYNISNFTVMYLMHELHFEGLSDMAIVNHTDWQLFGLDKYQVQERILDLNMRGGYLAQCGADLMTISWNYNSMEEFINGTL